MSDKVETHGLDKGMFVDDVVKEISTKEKGPWRVRLDLEPL